MNAAGGSAQTRRLPDGPLSKGASVTIKRRGMPKRSGQDADVALAITDDSDPGIMESLVGYALRRAQLNHYRDFMKYMTAENMRPSEFAALAILRRTPSLTQTVLAAKLGIERSGVVLVVDNLEQRGLILRVPSKEDRRSYALEITPTGHATFERLSKLNMAWDRRFTEALSDGERQTLLDLLHRLY
jgi:DNA-binding MarR family transcriptional regulator